MRLSSVIVSLVSLAATSLATPIERATLPTTLNLPFNFTYLFTATLEIGKPSNPIQIAGGTLLNEPVVAGTITGPAVNGTIQGGFAHPSVYNTTMQVPGIDLYGVTNDNSSFYIHEAGVGLTYEQVTRIELYIGESRYSELSNGFILATVNPISNRTIAYVEGYLVQNTRGQVS
ncbi:hypothetical protein LTR10_020336 [Elasticomyces elasticus]|uniref:Uncharacterized protein n=1 Tax=Exophiala sideris TaxID=1016849 RepID=A0ABR0J9N3_9EURO|nr:hypothetical protein LTR10_020336 [Elasticomyces elasticus]KAK5022800.1 hypothetical protein LTS07_009778 [Exophiala sideris]KAK5026702.1 hypothetical protein LTR13_009926 [Exophiala sideris]KAK5059427.1 hypothetical protein LTR69_006016 [Exophiala sideris]KAK5177429.1 hypothetical protein LTR44_010044 [Eurotiomycetes sp. CCFEE 6388]